MCRVFLSVKLYDLIETSWNVKVAKDMLKLGPAWDLIETSWNVKFTLSSKFCAAPVGFNRNIVECKAM